MRKEDEAKIISRLASVFKGGRISGWVTRNRKALESERWEDVELGLLLQLSPSFVKGTVGLGEVEKINLVVAALMLADESPLSATRLII